jgi:oligopeptide/dipeptide ABC transporter ATP-binding protein
MENEEASLLEVRNLTKKYVIKKEIIKKHYFKAVDNVSFSINKGDILGLIGESGSGKSTIGKLVLKLILADEGQILFKGIDIKNYPEKSFRKETSIIFQDPRTSLNPRFKVKDIIEEPLIVHKVPKSKRKKIVVDAIINSGLDETFLERYPSELSGGQRQRVAIARAIALNPDFIVADEPTSALDVSVQLQIINLIKNLNKEKHITFLFISHDLNVVGMLANKIVVLYRGKIMEKGNKEDILKNPLHPYTKLLIDSLPPIDPFHKKHFENLTEINREDIEGACVFYHRCPIAQDICKKEPPIKKINNREVYCYFV